MKNKILILLMVCGIMIVGSGCGGVDFDRQRIANGINPNNRFQPTADVFVTPIGYKNLSVLEDTKTGILYLTTSYGGITVWLDENGEPMKADK